MVSITKITTNKVVQNFSFMTVGNMVSQVLALITVLKITQHFAPDDYGLYTFITSQGLLLLSISDLGIQPIIVRSIARDSNKTSDLILNGLLLRILTIVILTGLYILYNHLFGTLSIQEVLLVSLCGFVNALWTVLEYAFLGNQKMFFASAIKIIYGLLWFGFVFLLPEESFTVYNLIFIFVTLNILQGLGLAIYLRKNGMMKGQKSPFLTSTKSILIQSWPYFSVMLIMIPVQQFYNIYLELNSTVDEIGFFNLARRLLAPVQMILNYAVLAAFPSLSALWVSDQKKLYNLLTNGFQYFLISGISLAFMFNLFIEDIVILLFSEEYLPAVRVTQMQVWFTFLMAVNYTISTVLGAINKEKLMFNLAIMNGLISIPMMYYGSQFGAYGLSVAYVLSFAVFEIILWMTFRKQLNIKIKKEFICWTAALALFLISTFLINDLDIQLKISLSVLICIVVGLYFIKNYKKDYQNE
ncbi:oligosaccharide flippase family protein [Algoriphagus sp. AGSA1]|uniref:oligosaccharide flippase family protein n=1 Tax=Algoriphagus sp. AGSA1 TaxID=2907213 RepID=UPI0021D42D35|nr:oligosaccharide flippase family protein [Algoriphagus sp. AGSA1]